MIKTLKNIFSNHITLFVVLIFSLSTIIIILIYDLNSLGLFANDVFDSNVNQDEFINYNIYKVINPGYNKPLFDYFRNSYLINLSPLYEINLTTGMISAGMTNMYFDFLDLDYVMNNPAQFKNYIT